MDRQSDHRAGIVGIVFGVALVLVAGCKPSPSEKWLQECEQAEARGDVDGAWRTCSLALMTDPTSKFADVAQEKLKKLQPAYDKLEKERAEKKAQAAKAEQAAREARLAALRQKVTPKWWGFEPDSECQAKGLPPFRKTYEGGLYAENETVALADGCRHLFGPHVNPDMTDNVFCCPGGR